MAIYYFDASAVVKRYINEPGSAWVRELCDTRDETANVKSNLVVMGDSSVAEVAAAFAVLTRRRVIPQRIADRAYRKFVSEYQVEYDLAHIVPALILDAAGLTQHHPLKAYDAVQLALALHANKSLQADNLMLTFVSGDDKLLQAAQAEGLATDNPFNHAELN